MAWTPRTIAIACVAAAAAVGGAPTAGAAEAPGRVVLVGMDRCCRAEAWSLAETKTAAELASIGLAVDVAEGVATEERAQRLELTALAEERGASIALRIVRAREERATADVWITDRATGKTSMRRLRAPAGSAGTEAGIIALRVVELLRASLMELAVPGTEPSREPPPPPAVVKIAQESVAPAVLPARKEPGPFGVTIGAAAIGAFNDAGFFGGPQLSISYDPVPAMTVELEGAYLPPVNELSRGAARASFSAAAARAWAIWNLLPGRAVQPSAGVGGGAVFVVTDGVETAAYRGTSDATGVGYLGGIARVACSPWERVRLRLDLRAGRAIPEVIVNFGRLSPAGFGKPLLELGGGVEIRLP